MNANSIDLIALRMIIRSTRENMRSVRNDTAKIKEYDRLATLLTKYQAWHIQKTGELYYR